MKKNPDYLFDFFIQSWNSDLEYKYKELYNPVSVLYEDNNKYRDFISKLLSTTGGYFNQVSQAIAIKNGCCLIEDYSSQKGMKYDVIVIYRPDILIWKDLLFKDYDLYKIYVNGHGGSNGDFHFIMSYKKMQQFKRIVDFISINNPPLTHCFIRKYVEENMHEQLYMDYILPGRDQEAVRKLYPLVTSKMVSMDVFKEYGLTEEELKRYNPIG